MGKGDRKTRKGKIWRGSYGKTRKHKGAGGTAAVVRPTGSTAKKKR